MKGLATAVETDDVTRLRTALGRLSRRLRAAQTAAGLTQTQLSVLFTVYRAGSFGLSDLAGHEGLNPTMLSRVVAHLVDRGLLRRHVDADDRRSARVEATAAGRRLCERMRRERNDVLVRALGRLPAAERNALTSALTSLESLAELLEDERRGPA